MACQCKVNQQIDYLHKKYGDNTPENKKTNIRGSMLAAFENVVIFLLVLPLAPFMILFGAASLLGGKRIKIDKFLKRAHG